MRIKAFFLSILAIGLLVLVFARNSVFAAPSNNPVFATIEQVQQMINNALSPLTARLNNHEGRIATLESNLTVTPSPSPSLTPTPAKVFRVLDKNNVELGIFMAGGGTYFQLYLESLGRYIYINKGYIEGYLTPLFESDDCSGTPYINNNPYEEHMRILKVTQGRYYIMDKNAAPITIHAKSQWYRGCINKLFHFSENVNLRNINRIEA